MESDRDITKALAAAVREAAERRTPLRITGSATKSFYGRRADGAALDVTGHRGIVAHEPTELVLTARAGTPLAEIETVLADKGQMLAFEPPYFGESATLGGTIACGFSGPRRPYAGAARDFVLGARIINGRGEVLRFGGEVMKNVAGYDASRLMVGALGTLGVLLDVSLKVLPRPEEEITLAFDLPADEALAKANAWAGQPLPLSAACYLDDVLYVRLSGSAAAVRAAQARLGGDGMGERAQPWHDLREHRLSFFEGPAPLWRLSVPAAAPIVKLPGRWLLDWGGAQRWLRTDAPADQVFEAADHAGGHATLFRGGDRDAEVFQPLDVALARLHSQLKRAFDPHDILNKGRLYRAL